jgi:hypothetical protein
MSARLVLLVAVFVGGDVALGQDQWLPFDVGGGMISELVRSELEPNTGIACQLRVTDLRYKEEWGPSFSIVLAEMGDMRRDAQGERFVQLSMTVGERDRARIYRVTAVGVEGEPPPVFPDEFLGLEGDAKDPVLRLAWREDGVFSYSAVERGIGFGHGRVSEARIKPKVVIVSASGMSGTVYCQRYDV